MSKINTKLVVFISVLIILSAFFRFCNFSHLSYWMFDEERDAFVVKRILVDHHFTLIGGSIPGGFYLAPGYFYVSSIFYFFSHGNPLGPAIAASSLGVLSTVLLFAITLKFFGKKIAVFSSLLYTGSYLVVVYNRTWWPLTFAPLVSLITYYSLYKLVKYKNFRWAIPLSLVLILGAQSDPSNFSLIILTILVWMIYRLPLKNKFTILGIFLFLFSHTPLFIFDLRHNFLNSRQLLKMLTFGHTGAGFNLIQSASGLKILPQTFARFIFVSTHPDTALQIIPTNFYVQGKVAAILPALLFLSLIILIYFFFKLFLAFTKPNNLPLKIIGLHLIIAVLGVIFYNILFPGYTNEWFFQVLFPAFAIVLGLSLADLSKKRILAVVPWVFITVFLFFSFLTITGAKNSYNFADKSSAVKWALKEVGDKPFSLDSIGQNFAYGGYRYLFYLYGQEPVKSYMDPVFADWMYPKSQLSQTHPDKVVVVVNPDFFNDSQFQEKYNRYLQKTITRQKFGIIEVLIVDNSARWVTW